VTGLLSVRIVAEATNVVAGWPVRLTALIEGRTSFSLWDFGDAALSFNQPHEVHAWAAPGDYVVSLWALNESQPDGVSASLTVHVTAQAVHYVAADSINPQAPYTTWATAATSIQDAVDAAVPGALVWVSNGCIRPGRGRCLGRATGWR